MGRSLIPHHLVVLLSIAIGLAELSLAKGLDTLTPGTPTPQTPETSKPSTAIEKDKTQGEEDGEEADKEGEGKEEEGEEKEGKTPEAAAPTGPFNQNPEHKAFLAVGFGFAYLERDGEDWRASGASDVVVGYHLGVSLWGGQMAITGRYAPIAVAPHLEEETDEHAAYRGVVQGYLLGTLWQWPLGQRWLLTAATELGGASVHLVDLDGKIDEDPPNAPGFLGVVSGGGDYALGAKTRLGGRLRLGGGAFTTAQLTGTVSLIF